MLSSEAQLRCRLFLVFVACGLTAACAMVTGNDLRGDRLSISVGAPDTFSIQDRTYSRSALVPGLRLLKKSYPNLTLEFKLPAKLLDDQSRIMWRPDMACYYLVGYELITMADEAHRKFLRIETDGSAREIPCPYAVVG